MFAADVRRALYLWRNVSNSLYKHLQDRLRPPHLPSIGKQLGLVYMAYAANGLLGLAVVPLGLKYLKADGYGLLGLYTAFASYLTFADLGLSKTLIRKLAITTGSSERKTLFQLAITAYIATVMLLTLITPLLVFYLPRAYLWVPSVYVTQLRTLIVLAVIDYILSVPATVSQSWCMADQRFDRYARLTVAFGCSKYAVMLLAISVFHSPVAVSIGLALRRVIDFATVRYFRVEVPWRSFNLRISRESLVFAGSSFRQGISQISLITVISSVALIANSLYGLAAAGIYRASFDLTTKVLFISNGVAAVMFPYFSRLLLHPDRARLCARLVRYLNGSWAMYLFLVVISGWLSRYMLPLARLPGRDNQLQFLLLLFGTCMNAHATVSLEFLQASNKYLQIATVCLVSLVVLVTSAVALKGSFGMLSLAAGWMLSQTVMAVVSDAVALAPTHRKSALGRMCVFKLTMLGAAILVLTLEASATVRPALIGALGLFLTAGIWANWSKRLPSSVANVLPT